MKHVKTISKDAPARAAVWEWLGEVYKGAGLTPKQQYINELNNSEGSWDPEDED